MSESITKSRAARRREERDTKKKQVTYQLTQAQIDMMFKDKYDRAIALAKKEATDDAVNTAMVLLLTLPLEVLMDHYWTKSYRKRIPEFTSYVLQYYQDWQNGELSMEKMQDDLWNLAGIRLEEHEESEDNQNG
jgi:hypothetical protein